MATVRKSAGGKWIVEVRRKGFYKSKSFAEKREAILWGANTEAEFLSGKIIAGRSLGDAFERYAKEVSPTKKGARWEIVRLNKLQKDPLAQILCTNLTYLDINAFIARRLQSVQNASVNRELSLIRSVVERARKNWNWCNLATNPVSDANKPPATPPRERRIDAAEEALILKALDYDPAGDIRNQHQATAAGFLLALETGMRQGELWGLKWQDVNLNKAFATLRDTKNGYGRDVALSSRALQVLAQLQKLNELQKIAGNKAARVLPYNQAGCGQIFRRALQLAGIKGLTFHDTRHEAVTRLSRKLDMLDLARMIGHRDPRSLMIYYNATAEEIAKRLG